ncbi:MAG: RpiB/LacA/LacB family sugar-phosphate isomerase [Desulfurococcales archaeon]|jgi:ribose 5-phosphate isomerase B|nr:RpiB/LacA/LacB family sugar-phosphate isomerase [Desulfurococcales archaeon]MCC6062491.1 RpiB/LacA/LacB family sugar-phosphate isomerase [Desulfurococcales archaeon]MCI4457094.1 RpiB/LacA/LacB family sugar-phosphate isomerase [Desulfurococcaceae archaeon]NAZ13332.1 RpiB/LacA/LacB family sugar-phosphate isomerase [Desulfurococcales archaeon]
MRVAIGSDDLYPAALFLKDYLSKKGFELVLIGSMKTGKPEPWPRVGREVGELVANKSVDFGIVICYTGTGVSIAANKVKGVRAALVFDAQTARGARLWNDANVLALSGRLTSPEIAKEIIEAWLETKDIDPSERDNIEELKRYDESRC